MRKTLAVYLIYLVLIMTAGCHYLHPYHVDIQQGRKIRHDQLVKLKTGMSKGEVAHLIGTPLLKDPLHKNRWSYVYYHRPSFGRAEIKRLVLYFKNGRVDRISTDYNIKQSKRS